jgi:hypothetical protein
MRMAKKITLIYVVNDCWFLNMSSLDFDVINRD